MSGFLGALAAGRPAAPGGGCEPPASPAILLSTLSGSSDAEVPCAASLFRSFCPLSRSVLLLARSSRRPRVALTHAAAPSTSTSRSPGPDDAAEEASLAAAKIALGMETSTTTYPPSILGSPLTALSRLGFLLSAYTSPGARCTRSRSGLPRSSPRLPSPKISSAMCSGLDLPVVASSSPTTMTSGSSAGARVPAAPVVPGFPPTPTPAASACFLRKFWYSCGSLSARSSRNFQRRSAWPLMFSFPPSSAPIWRSSLLRSSISFVVVVRK
mmetsp:Transcript_5163/g.18634  ORF Transcript_5163/g.18634 Transcript_5163/m.18634 type:complete len:270 (+) Transcript_5163:391-1200(+)